MAPGVPVSERNFELILEHAATENAKNPERYLENPANVIQYIAEQIRQSVGMIGIDLGGETNNMIKEFSLFFTAALSRVAELGGSNPSSVQPSYNTRSGGNQVDRFLTALGYFDTKAGVQPGAAV